MRLRPAIALLTLAATSAGQAQTSFAPGEGILCATALYHAAAQAGKRCFSTEVPALQAELAHSLERLDAFILSDPDWTQAKLAQFKDEQAAVESGAEPCQDQAAILFRRMMAAKPETLRDAVGLGTARPGKPTWGMSPRGESIDEDVTRLRPPTWRDCL